MRILVVEDDSYRIEWFQKATIGHIVDFAIDADSAIVKVHQNDYDLIFLDHDLGNRQMVSSDDPNTGYTVAKSLIQSRNSKAAVVIHSLNPVGALNIKRVVGDQAMIYPYFQLIKGMADLLEGYKNDGQGQG